MHSYFLSHFSSDFPSCHSSTNPETSFSPCTLRNDTTHHSRSILCDLYYCPLVLSISAYSCLHPRCPVLHTTPPSCTPPPPSCWLFTLLRRSQHHQLVETNGSPRPPQRPTLKAILPFPHRLHTQTRIGSLRETRPACTSPVTTNGRAMVSISATQLGRAVRLSPSRHSRSVFD